MSNSVKKTLAKVNAGDSVAEAEIVERFADKIQHVATRRLDGRLSGKLSPEDVVQSVFRSFFRRNQEGEFHFENWKALGGLLATIAARKCTRSHREFTTQSRNVDREDNGAASFASAAQSANEPTPDELVALRDTIDWALSNMDDKHQQIILLGLSSYSAREIARIVGRTQRTVRRVLDKFRERLESQFVDD